MPTPPRTWSVSQTATSPISKCIGTRATTLRRAATILRPNTITNGAEIDQSICGAGSYNPTKNEFARIWQFENPPTNPATLRLSLATSGVRLAEIRIGSHNVG